MSSTQSLSSVANITVNLSPLAAAAPTFNQACVIGPSAHIPTYGNANPRIRLYQTLAQMTSDGFLTTDPEYIAAELYFGQTPQPQNLWVSRQDTTAIQTLVIHAGNAGTNYKVNDVITIGGAGTNATATVTTIGTNGTVTGLALATQGTGYAVANGVATTGGSGTALEVDITAIGETALQAVVAARTGAQQWYICYVTDAGTADHEAIAPYIESITPPSLYFYDSSDLTGAAPLALQALNYRRTFGLVSTTQNGAYPNNNYAGAAVMGVAMGLNSGLANSYFTLKFKNLSGVSAEPLSASQVSTLEGYNANILLNFANIQTYTWVEQGTMANGTFFDVVLGIDQLVADIQYSLVNTFISQPSIPQDNAGQTLLLNAVNSACARAVTRGFLAPGTWQGIPLLNLNTGDTMPSGYLAQSQSTLTQSAGDRAARKAMPIILAVLGAGAVHSIALSLTLQQ